jgi:hypothetical protein
VRFGLPVVMLARYGLLTLDAAVEPGRVEQPSGVVTGVVPGPPPDTAPEADPAFGHDLALNRTSLSDPHPSPRRTL